MFQSENVSKCPIILSRFQSADLQTALHPPRGVRMWDVESWSGPSAVSWDFQFLSPLLSPSPLTGPA